MGMTVVRNWKTTTVGWIVAIALCVAEYHQLHHISAATLTTAMGVAGVGTFAKDSDVTGGTREQ